MRGANIFGRKGAARKGTASPFAPAKGKRAAKPRPMPRPIGDIDDLPAGQRVVCAWPAVELSPNARVHWSKHNRIAKTYHADCWALALEAKLTAPATGKIVLRLDFFPPDRRDRDDDNAIAAFKHGRDGIAKAMKVDDSRFSIVPVWHVEPRACVVVTIVEGEGA